MEKAASSIGSRKNLWMIAKMVTVNLPSVYVARVVCATSSESMIKFSLCDLWCGKISTWTRPINIYFTVTVSGLACMFVSKCTDTMPLKGVVMHDIY